MGWGTELRPGIPPAGLTHTSTLPPQGRADPGSQARNLLHGQAVEEPGAEALGTKERTVGQPGPGSHAWSWAGASLQGKSPRHPVELGVTAEGNVSPEASGHPCHAGTGNRTGKEGPGLSGEGPLGSSSAAFRPSVLASFQKRPSKVQGSSWDPRGSSD